MKTILIPIYKKHNINIFDTKEKTEEIRKTKPKGIECHFKCVVYEPKKFGGCGKVIGEFIVDRIEAIKTDMLYSIAEEACISKDELFKYLGVIQNSNFNDYNWGYAWHITAPLLYEKPKELGEFYRPCIDKQNDCVNCGFARIVYPDPFGDGKVVDCDLKVKRPPQSYMRIEEV